MPANRPASLWNALSASSSLSASYLCGAEVSVVLGDLAGRSVLGPQGEQLRGRSVLVTMLDQLTAALALIELDGIARRIVLCPSDLPFGHIPFVMEAAGVEAVVSDQTLSGLDDKSVGRFMASSRRIAPMDYDPSVRCQTEWILLTSGTTGLPKLVVHTLASLTGAIESCDKPASRVVWSTFYDIRRYGGLQIFLRAVLSGTSLVLSEAREPTTDFLLRAGSHGVTHISGTPSHWRRALMSPQAHMIAPRYIRLSGEIADQAILNHLRAVYPEAGIAHAFASTEAGVAFDVADGIAGFPASLIGNTPGVDMKVENRSLRIRSTRTASHYLGEERQLKDADGFVDTADVLELRDDRYHFRGRRDGIINVGGGKVYPEEVEAVINRHPGVQTSVVRMKRNSITGALVVADVVLKIAPESTPNDICEVQRSIVVFCRAELPAHKVPAAINFVPSLAISETGKVIRRHA